MRKLLLAVIVVHGAATGQNRGMGYENVEAARAGLKAKAGTTFSEQGGWTIVADAQGSTIWSFTPPGHPAHPAVVKRSIVQRDGVIAVEMSGLCEASKPACDSLMDEFKKLNEKMAQSVAGSGASQPKAGATNWQPTARQEQLVRSGSEAYFTAKDRQEYEAAYGHLSPVQKETISFERWRSLTENFNAAAGPVRKRVIEKITWYKDPPKASPGVYAAVDFSGQYANVDTYCGYVVWVEQPDGKFLLLREEQNFIDKTTQQKLKPEELAKARAQFGCKG
jgi:hypothetical protein